MDERRSSNRQQRLEKPFGLHRFQCVIGAARPRRQDRQRSFCPVELAAFASRVFRSEGLKHKNSAGIILDVGIEAIRRRPQGFERIPGEGRLFDRCWDGELRSKASRQQHAHAHGQGIARQQQPGPRPGTHDTGQ